MTREEAKAYIIQHCIPNYPKMDKTQWDAAMGKAIEALRQPDLRSFSCGQENDLISRQAALDAIMGQPPEPHYPSWYAAQIEKLPAVQPEQRWIPIKNRLPAVRCCRCLITRDDGRGRATVEEALFSFGRWYSNEWLEDGRNRKFDISASVIAWAPFPAPYRGGEK